MPSLEESQCSSNGLLKFGNGNNGQEAINFLNFSKKSCSLGVNKKDPFLIKSIKGTACLEYPFTNLLQKPHNPRKTLNYVRFTGQGHSIMTQIFLGSMRCSDDVTQIQENLSYPNQIFIPLHTRTLCPIYPTSCQGEPSDPPNIYCTPRYH